MKGFRTLRHRLSSRLSQIFLHSVFRFKGAMKGNGSCRMPLCPSAPCPTYFSSLALKNKQDSVKAEGEKKGITNLTFYCDSLSPVLRPSFSAPSSTAFMIFLLRKAELIFLLSQDKVPKAEKKLLFSIMENTAIFFSDPSFIQLSHV